MLLHGAGLRLRTDDASIDHRLNRPCEPFHFAGDVAPHATLLGGPSGDFNVMVRRGVFRCAVT